MMIAEPVENVPRRNAGSRIAERFIDALAHPVNGQHDGDLRRA
jgi:hypothetical protein